MKLDELANAVRKHAGDFLCEEIGNEKKTRIVRFRHVVTAAPGSKGIPAIGRLRDFYDTFGSVLFYYDEESEDSARYIAPPAEWSELRDHFNDWIEILDEEDRSEAALDWVDTCLVIGETPHSGNYVLMAAEGSFAGHIFEFDHDGFEFAHRANDVVEYVEKLLVPDDSMLTDMASHMRFATGDRRSQWWIREMKDNQGHIAITSV